MEQKSKGFGDILSTITIAVLFMVILLLTVFAASSYQHGTTYRSDNDNSRAVLSYVITAVKGSDGAEVTTHDFDGAPGIIIAKKGSQYEQRIYMKDGKMLEEYGLKGGNISPESAQEIGTIGSFEANYMYDDVLEIKTDLGTSYVHTERNK